MDDTSEISRKLHRITLDRIHITKHLFHEKNWILGKTGKRFGCISGILSGFLCGRNKHLGRIRRIGIASRIGPLGQTPFPLLRTCCDSMSITKSC